MNEDVLGGPLSDEERFQLQAEMQQNAENERAFRDMLDSQPTSSTQEASPTQTTKPTESSAQNTNELKPIESSPYRKEDGSLDIDKVRAEGAEFDKSLVIGLQDTAIDLLNYLPNVDIEKTAPFENEVAQTFRDMSSIVLPSMALSGVGAARLTALAQSSKAQSIPKLAAFLNDPAVKWWGPKLWSVGSGALVDYVAEVNQTDDNLLGFVQQTWPRTLGWIPDSIATTEFDTPDKKRMKNVVEGAWLGFITDALQGYGKLATAQNTANYGIDFGIIPENEKGKAWFKNNVVIDETPEDVVERMAAKRSDALDEIGNYNADRQIRDEGAIDPTKPLFGYNDAYAAQESGVRSVDDLGIVGASVDAARIEVNLDTTYGRVGSVISDGAIKFANESAENGEIIIQGLAQTLRDAGEYGYKSAKGKYLSHAEIMSIGQRYADDFYGMDLKQLQAAITPGSKYQGVDADTQIPTLTTEAVAGAYSAIRKYVEDFINMDEAMARAYTSTSIAGQISDTSQGMRLTDGSGTIARAQEQILDRVEFLMAQVGKTRYVRGRALNMLAGANGLRTRLTQSGSDAYRKAEAKRLESLIKDEKNTTLQMVEIIKQDASEMVDSLREISKTRPKMLGPLMMAYELTDGKVNSITSLNDYVKKSTSVWKKAFYDGEPDIPSVINRAFFSTVYNHTLSAISTPLKAVISGSHLLIEKPVRHLGGALMTSDKATLRRGFYQYSNGLESIKRGLDYAKQIYKRSAVDPQILEARDDVVFKDAAQLEVLNATADALADEGEYGAQALMEQINLMVDVANSPHMRFGTRSMQAMDGFIQSMIADFEAKGRAFDQITKGGTLEFDASKADEVYKSAHAKMFNEDGIITDEAVKRAAGELAFNLDNQANKDFSQVIRRFPIMKPFFLFTKTPLNEIAYTYSYNPVTGPLGLFLKDLDKFRHQFDDMPLTVVRQVLEERGVKFEPLTAKAKYNEIRADIMGRRAIGGLLTTLAIGLVMDDRLHGSGHYNRRIQKTREKSGWKPVHYKGLDGKWYSYDGLGPVTNYLKLVADIADHMDVLQPNQIQDLLARSMYVLGASFVDKTYMAGVEPFLDVFRGDVGAINRWSSSFLTAANVPKSSLMAEISRFMDPGRKQINNDLASMVMNRLPLFKSALPAEYDWINGGEVTGAEGFFARVVNTYLPWKINGEISEEQQFLIDIEYDAAPTLRTNGRGVPLSNEMQSEILNKMGQDGNWKAAIRRVMQSTSGKEFRRDFKRAQQADAEVDVGKWRSLHEQLDLALRESIKEAYYDSKYLTKIQRLEWEAEVRQELQRRGDIEGLRRFNSYKEKSDNRRNP